jgi:hypothetical protein
MPDFPPALRALLENAAIPKLGANIKSACAPHRTPDAS